MSEPASTADVILHVGLPQTGAAVLHRAFTRLRPHLRRAGLAIVSDGDITATANARGWSAHPDHDPSRSAAFERELAALVDAELARTSSNGETGRTVVLSSDNLLGGNIDAGDADRFRPHAATVIAQAIRALDADRVQILLYTRRQDRLMELCYLHEVLAGGFHSFADQFPYRFEPILDYVELIGRINAIPGVQHTVVRPYEAVESDGTAILDDFLDAVGQPGAVDPAAVGVMGLRRVYTHQGLDIALAMNPHLDTSSERRRVRDFLLNDFSTRGDAGNRFLAAEDRLRIVTTYAARNRELFRTYLPDRPADSYAGDESTARLRTVPPRPPADTPKRLPRRLAAASASVPWPLQVRSALKVAQRRLPARLRRRLSV